jgi:hypothetical protein
MPNAPIGTLAPDETPWISSRPSILQAVQLRGLIFVAVGMILFYYGYYFLTSNLVSLILGKVTLFYVAVPTLTSFIVGYALVVIGTISWLKVIPRWAGHIILSLIIVVPLIFVTTWFSTLGDEVMLLYFLILGALLPLYISMMLWWRTRYALTDKRVLSTLNPSTMSPEELQVGEATIVYMDQGPMQRLAGVGDVIFARNPASFPGAPGESSGQVEWRGVVNPRSVIDEAREKCSMVEVPRRRRHLQVGQFITVIAIVAAVALILTILPVSSVTDYVDKKCGLWVSAQSIENDPWPYISNVTIPMGNVSFTWWSGSPLWLVIVQLPTGISYQNTVMDSLYPQNQSKLTSSGSGTFVSYGGTFLTMCVSTNSEATVTLKLSYSAPLVWE